MKKKLQKAANGLQDIVGGALGGASAGAALGPWGILAGGVLGAGSSYLQQKQQQQAADKLKQQQLQQQTWGQVQPDVQSMSQLTQYKQGAEKVKTKAIEIEGGEPHFSAPVNGKRVLKNYLPGGPTHEQGGIPVVAASGDAVVTAKNGKGARAAAAHAAGDHQQVEKLIRQMPADKGKPKARGGLRKVAALTPLASQAAPLQAPALTASALPGQLTTKPLGSFAFAPQNTSPTTADKLASTAMAAAPDIATGIAQAAPTLYNLAQGIVGSTAKTTRRNFSASLLSYEDQSAPSRQASLQAMRSQVSNARNLSGGSAGNLRANAAAAYADNSERQIGINSQEAARKLQVGNENVGILNNAQLVNNQMNDRADELDLENAAKKQEALASGLSGVSSLVSNTLLQKNLQNRDAQSAASLGQLYKNYELKDGKWVLKARKGVKQIK